MQVGGRIHTPAVLSLQKEPTIGQVAWAFRICPAGVTCTHFTHYIACTAERDSEKFHTKQRFPPLKYHT
jgi:hypothetical protein